MSYIYSKLYLDVKWNSILSLILNLKWKHQKETNSSNLGILKMDVFLEIGMWERKDRNGKIWEAFLVPPKSIIYIQV